MKSIIYLWQSLRPKQWTKNLFVFAGILFSQNIFETALLSKVTAAFVIFCLLAGAVYLINDVVDRERDRLHPVKSQRPIAAGRLPVPRALAAAGILLGLALAAALVLDRHFFYCAAAYLFLQVGYSFVLKNIVILDIFSITAGFVLRVVSGAVVIQVVISSWLLLCAVLLALFLALSKRRHEMVVYQEQAWHQRKVLQEYSLPLVDQMMAVVTAATVMSYALYTMAPETIEKFGTEKLIFSVPFVLFGIFRYLYLVHKKGMGESPETALTRDAYLWVDIVLWIAVVGWILYT